MQIISRAEAKASGLKRFFTGKPCKNGHIAEISVSSYVCCECSRLKLSELYRADLEKSRAHRREYYAENSERERAKNAASRARNRESVLVGKKAWYERVKHSPEWRAKEKAKRDANKEAKRAYDKQYAIVNSAKKVERAREWIRANPEARAAISLSYDGRRRSQKAQGDSTAAIREWISAAKKVCYWCRAKCADEFHVDHYQPLSKGGEHRISNLVIACPRCNLRKSAKDPYEFAASVGRLF